MSAIEAEVLEDFRPEAKWVVNFPADWPHGTPPQPVFRYNRPYIQDYIPEIRVSDTVIHYGRETNPTADALPVLPGAVKPAIDTVYTPQTAPVETIAARVKVSRVALMDVPGFRAVINARLTHKVKIAEEKQILVGTGTSPEILGIINTVGVPTAATVPEAITNVSNADVKAEYIVVNPADLDRLRPADYGLWVIDPATGEVRVSSLLIRVSRAMPVGTGLVGGFAEGAVIYRSQDVQIIVGTVDDDIITNKLTIVGESRLALGVIYPPAFSKVTIP